MLRMTQQTWVNSETATKKTKDGRCPTCLDMGRVIIEFNGASNEVFCHCQLEAWKAARAERWAHLSSMPKGVALPDFDDFEEGEEFTTARRTITESDVVTFAGLSGDFNPIHMDREFAENTPLKGRVAHGMLVASIATGLGNQLGIFEGTTIAVLSMTINYKGAVKFGDTIHLQLKVTEKKGTSKPERGIVIFQTDVKNQKDELVIDGQSVVMMTRSK